MLSFNSLAIRNFMSVGNVTQVANLNTHVLTLVLGENLDLGGNDNRNGCGKTTILNALSYAIYGTALTNIRKDNLINKTNSKNMLVSLELTHNGTEIKIERGRRPNVFRVYVNGEETDTSDDIDEAQGDNRVTQMSLLDRLGLSHTMFKNIVALNTHTMPFFSMKVSEQRSVIEQLLGITKLSEKADKLKNEIKTTKDLIKSEEFKISALQAANKRLDENIESIALKRKAWESDIENRIIDTSVAIDELNKIDISSEIDAHKELVIYESNMRERTRLLSALDSNSKLVSKLEKSLIKMDSTLSSMSKKVCPTCNQDIDSETHEHLHNEMANDLSKVAEDINEAHLVTTELNNKISSFDGLKKPITFYASIDEANNHKLSIELLINELDNLNKEKNPYIDQEESLREGMCEIDYENINTWSKLKDHQEFLLKLLTNKDSFIRKYIIENNIAYLNSRLEYYITAVGLPHKVVFLPDLDVEISEHDRGLDFDNLSRGERTRLLLSLSWAFRDVYENLNGSINLLFVDEMLDSGLDTNGVENALHALKGIERKTGRSIFLVSHREELIGRVNNVLKVIKDGGFTMFSDNQE